MSDGMFNIYVKRDDDTPWGLLESKPYDDAIRGMRRKTVLKAARLCVRNWRYNYAPFINSGFAIEEQEDHYSPAVHIEGQRRDKVWGPRGVTPGRLKRKVPRKVEVEKPATGGKLVRKMPKPKMAKPFVPIPTVVEYEAPKVSTRKVPKRKMKKETLRAIKRHYRKQSQRKAHT